MTRWCAWWEEIRPRARWHTGVDQLLHSEAQIRLVGGGPRRIDERPVGHPDDVAESGR